MDKYFKKDLEKKIYINGSEKSIGIIYNDMKKDLPSEQLHKLFMSVGWSDGSETPDMVEKYNVPFINSTLVISAWENECLVGAVRVLSQNKGIGKELVKRCIEHFPKSEWLFQTSEEISSYYEKNGFKINNDVFLYIPCKLFSHT